MKKEYIFNKRLNEISKYEINELMKKKLNSVKSYVNIKCPISFYKCKQRQLRKLYVKKPSK